MKLFRKGASYGYLIYVNSSRMSKVKNFYLHLFLNSYRLQITESFKIVILGHILGLHASTSLSTVKLSKFQFVQR